MADNVVAVTSGFFLAALVAFYMGNQAVSDIMVYTAWAYITIAFILQFLAYRFDLQS